MLDVKKIIIVQAIRKNDGTLIPIWDDSIVYETTDEYGEKLTLKGDKNFYYPIHCLFNLETKELSIGIEIDKYPDKTEYQKGQRVYFETEKYKTLKEGTISDIVFEEFDLMTFKGADPDNWYNGFFKDLDPNQIYAIKNWKPIYVMDDGTKIIHDFKIYKIA